MAIGFPLLQCGLSTILFVLCLLFVDTYMSEVFVKTMVLVVSLGLLHGLVISPALLCALSNIYELGSEWRRRLSSIAWMVGSSRRRVRSVKREFGSIRIKLGEKEEGDGHEIYRISIAH